MSEPAAARLPDWLRAAGPPVAIAQLRRIPDDFEVTEELGFETSGDGEHDFLFVEKVDLTTDRVAAMLARFAGVPRRSIGFAGMKDRHARTRQWFSVHRPPRRDMDWAGFSADGVRILGSSRHRRKLKRGAHRANRFRIVLSDVRDPDGSIPERLARLRSDGSPNYFGEQRFGRLGGNLALAESLFSGRRLPRQQRSIALSSARSLIFNQVLSERVGDGSWCRLAPGDLAGLDGSGSVFPVESIDASLEARCIALDIHPTGPLWGRGSPGSGAEVGELELRAAKQHEVLRDGLETSTDGARRALRVVVQDLEWELGRDNVTLRFALVRGAFATAVLREIVSYGA